MKIAIEKSTNIIKSFAKGNATDFSNIDTAKYDLKTVVGNSLPSPVGTCRWDGNKAVKDNALVLQAKKVAEAKTLIEKEEAKILKELATQSLIDGGVLGPDGLPK